MPGKPGASTRAQQRGISLIEVLVAVVIFSIGLVGLAGLLLMASRSNQAAFVRTQVVFLVNGMADRMRANPIGVWNASYNGNTYPITGTLPTCNSGTPCAPSVVATRDQLEWSSQLTTFLPSPHATITCTNPSNYTPNTNQIVMRPPYGGNCVMTVTWSERSAGDANNRQTASLQTQTLKWNFQP